MRELQLAEIESVSGGHWNEEAPTGFMLQANGFNFWVDTSNSSEFSISLDGGGSNSNSDGTDGTDSEYQDGWTAEDLEEAREIMANPENHSQGDVSWAQDVTDAADLPIQLLQISLTQAALAVNPGAVIGFHLGTFVGETVSGGSSDA